MDAGKAAEEGDNSGKAAEEGDDSGHAAEEDEGAGDDGGKEDDARGEGRCGEQRSVVHHLKTTIIDSEFVGVELSRGVGREGMRQEKARRPPPEITIIDILDSECVSVKVRRPTQKTQ